MSTIDPNTMQLLFEHFCNIGEMPYGTAKARTGDPYEWITKRVVSMTALELNGILHHGL